MNIVQKLNRETKDNLTYKRINTALNIALVVELIAANVIVIITFINFIY